MILPESAANAGRRNIAPDHPGGRDHGQLAAIARQAADCTRCPLHRNAARAVFGEGPQTARLILVGEQPGDKEALAGRPFVGSAGRVLERALAAIGVERELVYLTNAVKHFGYEMRGGRRYHKAPSRDEVEACRWWLGRELAAIAPGFVVALGATAAFALSGRPIVLSRDRGRLLHWLDGRAGLATIHPSVILRSGDDAARQEAFAHFVDDLHWALRLAGRCGRALETPLAGEPAR